MALCPAPLFFAKDTHLFTSHSVVAHLVVTLPLTEIFPRNACEVPMAGSLQLLQPPLRPRGDPGSFFRIELQLPGVCLLKGLDCSCWFVPGVSLPRGMICSCLIIFGVCYGNELLSKKIKFVPKELLLIRSTSPYPNNFSLGLPLLDGRLEERLNRY